jgi:hypothetical protein
MKIEDFIELPQWDDDAFPDKEDAKREDWKPNPTQDLCKVMYKQWNQVMMVLKAAFDSLNNQGPDNLYPNDFIEDQVAMLISVGYEVGAKIRSTEAGL